MFSSILLLCRFACTHFLSAFCIHNRKEAHEKAKAEREERKKAEAGRSRKSYAEFRLSHVIGLPHGYPIQHYPFQQHQKIRG